MCTQPRIESTDASISHQYSIPNIPSAPRIRSIRESFPSSPSITIAITGLCHYSQIT
jgi:hypothetical protein